MFENMLKEDIICGGKEESSFLKMLMMRCQHPVNISGYGIFNMTNKNFKAVRKVLKRLLR